MSKSNIDKRTFLKKSVYKIYTFFCLVFILLNINFVFAENLDLSLTYGIENVAKSGSELPVEIVVNNKGSQKFEGYLDLNVYETNDSVYTYRKDIFIEENNQTIVKLNISLADTLNTIVIEIYNPKNELVTSDRHNIDLSYYNNKLIIGAISEYYADLNYIDNILVTDSGIETKLVELSEEKILSNDKILKLVDMLVISDVNLSALDENVLYSIEKFVESGKPIIISENQDRNGTYVLPKFIEDIYNDAKTIEDPSVYMSYRLINTNKLIVFLLPYSLSNRVIAYENSDLFVNILNNSAVSSYIKRISSNENLFATNDYYNISNLLNVVDKAILPNIFQITVFVIAYVLIMIIVVYAFLRNINVRKMYGTFVFIFALIATAIVFYNRFAIITKNVVLTYISMVDIRDANTSEKAFLSFRTNESGGYQFDTDIKMSLYPIMKLTREPIKSMDFLDKMNIKKAIIKDGDDRKNIIVENATSFDTSLYIYENNNYLNDIYNINCSFERFDGGVSGRITNNMGIKIHDAKLLLYGKVLDIGDINPNYSLTLSRARAINVPIANNEMLADILATPVNHEILKYYLDGNVNGYFDYALLFGFIDDNGTMDISSNSVGNVFGRTLIVTKVNDSKEMGISDMCSLQNNVENIEGYYDDTTNSIRGDEAVVNSYQFDKNAQLSKIYFENIDSYDSGNIYSNVPFYGDIYVYNLETFEYDLISDGRILYDSFSKYLTEDNQIAIRFVPTSRDPLYRMISLPVVRALGSN